MCPIDPRPENSKFNNEQWLAIQEYGSNILVAASAGSGKTTVLIERILTHLRKKRAKMNELLVVTFTEAAANEMKERLETQLKKEYNSSNQYDDQSYFMEQIHLLPQAHIQTLHSFCLHVIQNYFYLIDFNPSFELMTSEVEKEMLYEETWALLCQKIASNESQLVSEDTYQRLLNIFASHQSDQGLFHLIINLYLFAISLPEPVEWLSSISYHQRHFYEFESSNLYQNSIKQAFDMNLSSAIGIYHQLIDEVHYLDPINVERYLPFLEKEYQMVKSKDQETSQLSLKEIISLMNSMNYERWPHPPKAKENPDREILKVLKSQRDEAKNIILDFKKDYCSFSIETVAEIEAQLVTQVEALSRLTLEFYQTLSQVKISKNIIDYNDLEHLTLNILRKKDPMSNAYHPSLAALFYQNQFKEVLVDEYQDINEIQAEILSWLSHEHLDNQPGNLFMVGDVKQSIYGFRNAEPSLFLEKYASYVQGIGGQLIILDKNYRSRDEVLQFSNFIFERIMDDQFGEMSYGGPESLKTGNMSFLPQAPHPDYNIQLLLHENGRQDETDNDNDIAQKQNTADFQFDSNVEAQSYLVARKIQELIKEKKTIFDKENGQVRSIEYRDIVILSSTKLPFLQVQQVFDQFQIPLFAQKVENYFQRQEVQLMLALLKIIDNPYQDLPLVAILRSYFVGLDDDQLSQIRIYHRDKSYYEAVLAFVNNYEQGQIPESNQILYQKLKVFLTQLQGWRDFSLNNSVVALIWQIYNDTLFIEFVAGLSNAEQRLANLHGLYEEAQRFESVNFKGLYGFVTYIEEMLKYDKDLAEPQVIGSDQNFVRIMTVHASKGLEFPIVFLINTEKRFNLKDATTERVIALREDGVGIDYFDDENLLKYPSLVRKSMKMIKENQLKSEEMRKLYVALTRCEQGLYIVGSIHSEDQWLEKRAMVTNSTQEDQLVAPSFYRQKANSWLDWINIAMALPQNGLRKSFASFDLNQIASSYVNEASLLSDLPLNSDLPLTEGTLTHVNPQEITMSTEVLECLDEYWHRDYVYQLATTTSSYQSVSELKRLFEEPTIAKSDHFMDRRFRSNTEDNTSPSPSAIYGIRFTEDTFLEPKFMATLSKVTAAEIGTYTHQYLQHLNYQLFKPHPTEEYGSLIQLENTRLIQENYLNEGQASHINFEKILVFLQGELGQFIIQHGAQVVRETPFSLIVPAEKMFKNQVNEVQFLQLSENDLIIHGVIDAYIETASTVYLIDFKTDRERAYSKLSRAEQVNEIIKKYRFQMNLYHLALTNQFPNKDVKALLYLLDFGTDVKMNDYFII